jgi:sec-independent protein translocase protein TatC
MGDKKKTEPREYDPLETTMSLGDHLEELRMRLIYALMGLGIGLVVCLCFGKYIIKFMQDPYVDVMTKVMIPEDANDPELTTLIEKIGYNNFSLRTLGPTQGITSYIKISLIAGLVLSCPWVFYHLWMFVAAGLYPHERRYIQIATPFSAVLFIAGALFFLLVVAEISLEFLIKIDRWLGLQSMWTFAYYVSFVTMLMLVFGIAFQTPLAIFFLHKMGLVSIAALKSSRKYTVLAIVVLAAMATPPDVVSQVTLAIPLYILFELGIVLCYLSERKKKAEVS